MATKLNRLPVFLGQANCHLYHYAGNNPIVYTDPDGSKVFDARWRRRNWDNIVSLTVNASELATGIGIVTTTGITGAGLFYGSLMVIHGGVNTTVSLCKIAYTTVISDLYGDDYADKIDNELPDTCFGFIGYALGSLGDMVVFSGNSDSGEKIGALFDIVDAACGIAISMNAGNLNRAVDTFTKNVGQLIPKKDLIKLQKYAANAKKVSLADFIKGLIEKFDTASGLKSNAEQLSN